MKNQIIVLSGIFFLFTACKTQTKSNLLLCINQMNHLEILSVDDKCGEWGGNEKTITVYRDAFKGQLLADYVEKTTNCKNGKEPEIAESIKRIKLSDQESDLVLITINELYKKKLSKVDYPSHSGIYNRIMLSDSTIMISDFPSVELKSLNNLITKLKKK